MKKFLIFMLLSLSLFAISDEKKEKVLNDFNAFKKNYSERKAEETVNYFTPGSVKFYDDLLKIAISNGKAGDKIGFLESMVVMNIQNKLSAEEMKKMTGKDVIMWSINEGVDSFESFNILPILDIYDKDECAYVVVGYEKESMPVKLEESEGVWKVDLPYLYDVINKSFEKLFGAEGLDKNLFSENMMDDSNGNIDYYEFDEQGFGNKQAPRTKKSYY